MTDKQFWQLIGFTFIVYSMGIGVNVMDIDAAQYASMSREMMESGSYLQVYEHGKDYLDKPPLLFWLSALSMKIFGVGNFGYKFPSILFAFIAIYSTYRFAQLFYNETIAKFAALVLATSQALFLITNDCRTDTLLVGCVAFTFWQLAAAFLSNKWLHFLLGFVGIGFGMLAKGPVALIIPALAFTTHFIFKKEYKNFLRIEYLWGLVVIGLILLPMCIGLYQQFDLHPEKVVDGKTGTSGLRFFFWTQSFGRITGENKWHNAVYFSYLFEMMFWSFAPWILYFIGGLIASVLNAFKRTQLIDNQEFITTGGFILGYISLGTSNYQLPHYIFVLYPLAAVITARFLYAILYEKTDWIGGKILNGVQWFLITAMWALPFLIMLFVFPTGDIPLSITAFFTALFLISAFQKKQIFFSIIRTALFINTFASLYFYRELLKYQEGSEIGRFIKNENVEKDKFFTYKYPTTSSLHFYAQRNVQSKDSINQVEVGDWLLTDEKGLAELQEANFNIKYDQTGNTFSVTNMTPKFLNEKTRSETVGQYFLIKILEKVDDKKQPNKGNPLEEDENMDDEDAPLSMSNVHLKNL